ncbi:MAG: hypothetical protein ACREJ0_26490 [Geminicoccaceae bacterium]
MHRSIVAGTLGVAVAALLNGIGGSAWSAPPDIPFVMETRDMNDPDAPGKRNYIDFAELEYRFPLSPEDRMKITPDNLKELTQEQVDQIYARLPAGPIPDGVYLGGAFFPQGEDEYSRIGEVVGGIMGRGVTAISDRIERIATYVWKGKAFDRDNMVLRNLIEDRVTLEAIIPDDDEIETIEIERKGFLSIFAPTRTVWLLFPAKLHCGQSLLDSRRESIIIDYAYNDDLQDVFLENPDHWVNRKGLRIRDEIRMVRPGFYLGRAYINRAFILNFTLLNEDVAQAQEAMFLDGGDVGADCWPEAEQISASAG